MRACIERASTELEKKRMQAQKEQKARPFSLSSFLATIYPLLSSTSTSPFFFSLPPLFVPPPPPPLQTTKTGHRLAALPDKGRQRLRQGTQLVGGARHGNKGKEREITFSLSSFAFFCSSNARRSLNLFFSFFLFPFDSNPRTRSSRSPSPWQEGSSTSSRPSQGGGGSWSPPLSCATRGGSATKRAPRAEAAEKAAAAAEAEAEGKGASAASTASPAPGAPTC